MSLSPKMSDKQEVTCWYSLVSTSLGWLGVLASPKGIRRLTFPQASPSMAYEYLELSERDISPEPAPGLSLDIEGRLEQYLLGLETTFDDVLDVFGTPFQKRAWEVVRTIPRGETRSYIWVANAIGSPGAARAVGQAMRANPVPFIVPCHRVIGLDGHLCGYGGPDGVGLKLKLLEMERGHRDW
jgi:methylated-DNA-[protein]-cysteine S-methyltransferase